MCFKKLQQSNNYKKKSWYTEFFLLFLIYLLTDCTEMARHESAMLKINNRWPNSLNDNVA